jgi:hypothetical protein
MAATSNRLRIVAAFWMTTPTFSGRRMSTDRLKITDESFSRCREPGQDKRRRGADPRRQQLPARHGVVKHHPSRAVRIASFGLV